MSEKRIRILEGKILDKGSLYAKLKIFVSAWDLEIREVLVFKKGSEIWFNLPSKEFQDEDGQRKFMNYLRFGKAESYTGFQKLLREEFAEWEVNAEPAIPEKDPPPQQDEPLDEEMPF